MLFLKYALIGIEQISAAHPGKMANFEIINIKFSCKLSDSLDFKQIEEKFPFLSSFAGLGRIVFRHENFTYCVMGRKNTFLNVTGMKSFEDVTNSIQCFENYFTSPKILFPTFKFDSICAIYSMSPKIINTVLSPKVNCFWIKRYANILSRIIIKPKQPIGVSKGMTANIFQSGKCIIFGARNLNDLSEFTSLLDKSLQVD